MIKILISLIVFVPILLIGQNKFICITVIPDSFKISRQSIENPQNINFSKDSIKFLSCLKLHGEIIDLETKKKIEKLNKKYSKSPFFSSQSCIIVPGDNLNILNSFYIQQIELNFPCGFTQSYFSGGDCLSDEMKNLLKTSNCFKKYVYFDYIKIFDQENKCIKTIRLTLNLK